MQEDPNYQRTLIERNYWRPYPVLQKQDEDAKEWFNSDDESYKVMKLNKDCPFGAVGYAVPKEFDYMNLDTIRDRHGVEYGAAAYTVYFKGYFSTATESNLMHEVLVKYGLKTGEILCTVFDRRENGELNGTGYIKFRNSIVARLAIFELSEDPIKPKKSGQPMQCGNSQCRVYMMPSNREMLLPLYPRCRISGPVMRQIKFQGGSWLPTGPRTLHHPRMYSEENGAIFSDEYSDKLINDEGAGTEDTWLTVTGLGRKEQQRIKCLNCGEEGHVLKDCR